MTRKFVPRGTGITKVYDLHATDDDIEKVEAEMLKDYDLRRREGGDAFGAGTLHIIAHCEAVLAKPHKKPLDHDSPEEFAARILSAARLTREYIGEGKAAAAAAAALQMGWICSQAEMKRIWEPHALRGAATLERSREGHRAVHGTDEEKRSRWKLIYDDWQAEKASGAAKPALVVAQRHGVSERQVYRSRQYLKID